MRNEILCRTKEVYKNFEDKRKKIVWYNLIRNVYLKEILRYNFDENHNIHWNSSTLYKIIFKKDDWWHFDASIVRSNQKWGYADKNW